MSPSPFRIVSPCSDCPFRSDGPPWLDPARTEQIARDVLTWGESFVCHNTVEYGGHVEGRLDPERSAHCAGALILLEREGQPNQAMQLAQRFNLGYDATRLDRDAPVYPSFAAWVEAHGGDPAEIGRRKYPPGFLRRR